MIEMTKGKSKAKSVAKKAVIGVLTAVLAALTALVVYIMVCNSQGKAASLFGTSVLKVVSGSMEPSIHEGDYIIVRKTDISKLREDDIICFYSNDSAIYGLPNTHRIVKVLDNGNFVTKGDANQSEDSVTVSADRIIGKYTGKAAFIKWINSFASLKKLILLGIIVTVTVAAVYEVRTITKTLAENKVEKEQKKEEEKQRLIRQAIEREKQKLYEEGYKPEKQETEENKESEAK